MEELWVILYFSNMKAKLLIIALGPMTHDKLIFDIDDIAEVQSWRGQVGNPQLDVVPRIFFTFERRASLK